MTSYSNWESKKLFIFGRNPELSLAELIALHNSKDLSTNIYLGTEHGVIIDYTGVNKKQQVSVKTSGSILKKCKIITEAYYPYNQEWVLENLKEYMQKYLFLDNKAFWTVNLYNEEAHEEATEIYEEVVDVMAALIKHFLPRTKAFFKNQLPPIEINKKKIVEEGIELVLFFLEDKYYIGMTEEVIDIVDFNKHDNERPETTQLEQIGGALARSMINLVSIEENKHTLPIWDTFCGIGTIPQEARLMGLISRGTDISQKKIDLARKNLEWFKRSKIYNSKFKHASPKDYFEMDITDPQIDPIYNANIVSEPDLLEPLKYYPTSTEANKIIRVFSQNYRKYLKGIRKVIKDGVVVMIFPRIHCEDETTIQMNFEAILKERGFRILSYSSLLDIQEKTPAIFIHKWKSQIIEREIVVFKKISE